MLRYPRSFLRLVTLGYLLVLLPLLGACAYVVVTLEQINAQFMASVSLSSNFFHLKSDLLEDAIHLEKSLRRHRLLDQTESLEDLRVARADWQADLALLQSSPLLQPAQAEALQQLVAEEAVAFDELVRSGDPAPIAQVIERIRPAAQVALAQAQGVLEETQGRYLSEARAIKFRVFLAAASAVLFAVILLLSMRRLIARLLAGFSATVIRFGRGELDRPVELAGPDDFRWLGRWLEWLRQRLKSLEESRVQVLRHLSHELKTPLAALNEGAALLTEQMVGPLNADQRQIVRILHDNAGRLNQLIDGLLRLQQATHAAERLSYESFPLHQLIEEVVETHRLIASERGIRIRCLLGPVEIFASRDGVMSIVHNLVSNAIKFSPANGKVLVSLVRIEACAVIEVSDEGPGISAAERARVVEPFFRGSARQGIAGSGLGLAIVNQFVLAHRGSLDILDQQPGTRIRVNIPVAATHLKSAEIVH